MANPKLIRPCRNCGVTREHYTRRSGRIISPCCECQIEKAKARQDGIRDDPGALEEQREKWKRIKQRQRMIERGEVGVATGEPEVQPAQVPMTERRRRRREAVVLPPSLPPPRRRRRRQRSAQASMESGLD